MSAAAVPAGLLAREAAISAVINAAISAGFFFAMFGLAAPVPVWGVGNFAFDFLPQSLAVTFFASFVPSLLAGKAIASDSMPTLPVLFAQSLARGLAALAIGGAIWAALLWGIGVEQIAATSALVLKVLYGLLLGAAVTYRTLQRLSESGRIAP